MPGLGRKIEAGKIEVAIKMGEGGRAFGSVSSKEIAEEVKKQMDLTIDKKKVQLKEAIRHWEHIRFRLSCIQR